MYSVLNISDDQTHCGNIGHTLGDFAHIIKLAKEFSFTGINLDLRKPTLASSELNRILDDAQIVATAFGFYCHLFGSDTEFEQGLISFAQQASYAQAIGCKLALCYLPPFSESLNFDALFRRTVARLKRLKPILENHAIQVGFEFIGPTETRVSTRYDFIHTIDGVRALIAAAELYGHAGIKLDIHHWHNSGAGLLDLKHLDLEYILYVELNDGLAGFDRFTMPEFTRELPLTTGITPVLPFLKTLKAKGYQGPIAVEPWNQAIKDLPLTAAIDNIKSSLESCFALIDGQ